MTFDDDFIQIKNSVGRFLCKDLNISWPPPKTIIIEDVKYELIRYSQITDEKRSKMTHICRGAEYDLFKH